MIDTHIHVVKSNLPGSKTISEPFTALPEVAAARIRQEMQNAGIEQALAIGSVGGGRDDPLGIRATLQICEFVPGLHAVGVADPARTDAEHLDYVETELKKGVVKALKGYSGYLYYGPDSPCYAPYYALAARYQVPFIFHTGDTYSTKAKLKYAHPLLIDEAAVDFPDTRFVMAHFGNPWLTDAAEVIYKNDNVWADLSGVLAGDAAHFQDLERRGILDQIAASLKNAIDYSERPDRFLYGSDWPLVPMTDYRDFIEKVIPSEQRQAVFEENARLLFQL